MNFKKVNFEIFAVGTATIFYLFPVPFLFFMFYLDIFMMGPVLPGPTEADTTCSMLPINIIQREKRNSGKYRYYIKKFSEPITINLQRITIETNCYENWRIFLYFLTCQLLIYSTVQYTCRNKMQEEVAWIFNNNKISANIVLLLL